MDSVRGITAPRSAAEASPDLSVTIEDLVVRYSLEEYDGACTAVNRRPCGDCDCTSAATCPRRTTGEG